MVCTGVKVERVDPNALERLEAKPLHHERPEDKSILRFAHHAPAASPAMNTVTTSPTCR